MGAVGCHVQEGAVRQCSVVDAQYSDLAEKSGAGVQKVREVLRRPSLVEPVRAPRNDQLIFLVSRRPKETRNSEHPQSVGRLEAVPPDVARRSRHHQIDVLGLAEQAAGELLNDIKSAGSLEATPAGEHYVEDAYDMVRARLCDEECRERLACDGSNLLDVVEQTHCHRRDGDGPFEFSECTRRSFANASVDVQAGDGRDKATRLAQVRAQPSAHARDGRRVVDPVAASSRVQDQPISPGHRLQRVRQQRPCLCRPVDDRLHQFIGEGGGIGGAHGHGNSLPPVRRVGLSFRRPLRVRGRGWSWWPLPRRVGCSD